MRPLAYLLVLVFFIACIDSGTTTQESGTASNQGQISPSTNLEAIPKSNRQVSAPIKQQQKCTTKGELLAENQLWLKDQAKLICIIADSSTYDANLGMSHRIIEVYNTYNCELDLKLTLPINLSPDFPYYLADINYNNDSKIVAIKAAKTVYCLDLNTKKMLPLLTPKFKSNREGVDAASGTIIRLELWEDFLVGYAQDLGTFVFDLDGTGQTKPILPFAEFRTGESNFNSLFLLPSGKNAYQAILPTYDWEEEIFSINPIFKEPVALNTDIQKSALDNQFIVLRQTDQKDALLVDMKAQKNRSLPTALINKSTKEILAWAKK